MRKTSTYILSYGLTTAAGASTSQLWTALQAGRPCRRMFTPRDGHKEATYPEVHLWQESPNSSFRDRINFNLQLAWQEAIEKLSAHHRNRILKSNSLGIIFASTKGIVDDVIWKDSGNSTDMFTPILEDFISATQLHPHRKICVSNACTSGLAAVYLAKQWITAGRVKDVVVIAADSVGEFVLRGFQTLKVFDINGARPFDRDRSGFLLGEGSAVIVLSSEAGAVELEAVAIESEGYAVTRPVESGESLRRACLKVPSLETIDLTIAHGTATKVNDSAEDQTFSRLSKEQNFQSVVTASKWCIGHTLGVSGAIDLILACESLRQQKTFSIATSKNLDSHFMNRYLLGPRSLAAHTTIERALITSLGFGGVQAAASVRRAHA